MGIHVIGPTDWDTIIALNEELAGVPERGTFKLGGRHFESQGQFKRFTRAGVPTVEWTESLTIAKQWVRNGAAVLGRDRYHSRGEDIILVSNTRDITRAWEAKALWTKFVPSTAEWRFHIFDGRCISRDLKIFNRPGQSRGSLASIRDRAWDWSARHDTEPPPEARRVAIAAVASLEGYTHGAVDLLINESGSPVVLEVNRCPGMDSYTRERWCRAIRTYVSGHPSTGRTQPQAVINNLRRPEPRLQNTPFYEGVEIV